jgi:hypothetical protein
MEDNGMAKDEEREDARKAALEFVIRLIKANNMAWKVGGWIV